MGVFEGGFVGELGRSWRGRENGLRRGGARYQSIDWGGSSFEGEVLTVSTQPVTIPILSALMALDYRYENSVMR